MDENEARFGEVVRNEVIPDNSDLDLPSSLDHNCTKSLRPWLTARPSSVDEVQEIAVARDSSGKTTPKEEPDTMHPAAPRPNVFRYRHKVREA